MGSVAPINDLTRRVLDAAEARDYSRLDRLMTAHAKLIGEGECRICWYRIGDDVVCRRSWTQIDFCGHIEAEPRFKAPQWMHAYQPTEHARALDALAVAVESVAASEATQ
jgi:hypothetical protein